MTLYICPDSPEVYDMLKTHIADVHRPSDSGIDIPMRGFHVPAFAHAYSFGLGIRVAAVDEKGSPAPCLLLPRSSIYKTRFRLANSIGLIDAGYRGEVQAKTDVVYMRPPLETGEKGTRYFQICQHNFLPWKNIVLVKTPSQLPAATDTRGEGGFGSTDSLSRQIFGDE